jgi:predicted permease
MQLGVESLQLSLLGALVGALLARWSTSVLTRAKIGDLAMVVNPEARFSTGLLAFTIAVSVASGLVFAVAPAMRVARTDLTTPLKQGTRRSTAGRRGFVDRGLVGLQMALALLLVSGAMLLVQTLRNLQAADLGFDPAGRMAITVETRRTAYERNGMTAAMTGEMLRRVQVIPGVRSAAFGSIVPVYGGRGSRDNVSVRGSGPPPDGDPTASFAGVTPGYFASLGIPLLAGRDVDPPVALATTERSRSVVVNDRFAAKFFPGRDPLGQQFEDSDEGDSLVTENHVIGVVRSARFGALRDPPAPMYFVSVADHDWPFLVLVTTPAHETPDVGRDIARVIAAVAPGISQGDPSFLVSSIDAALARERVSAALAALFGVIALALVAVGLYGVMLYQVAERTPEIGIRLALGADAPRVMALVLRQSLGIVGVGVAGGLPLAILVGRAVASQLYGVEPYSVVALSLAATTLVVVGIAASFVPVRRALSVDPLTALRD